MGSGARGPGVQETRRRAKARRRREVMYKICAVAALAFCAGSAWAQSYPGNPADFYLLSDASNEVYQYERTSPWAYVPGAYVGAAKPMVFSNQSQVKPINPYLGAVA